MKKVDWKSFAEEHNMTKQEFADEIFKTAMKLGDMYLEVMNTDQMKINQDGLILSIIKIDEVKTVDN